MRTRLVLLALFVAASGSLFGLRASPKAANENVCISAARWIDQHPQDVPVSLDGIAALPAVYKRAAFSSLTPERKAALWREHLSRFLAKAQLTQEQTAFVQMAIDFATPQLYRDAANGRTPESEAKHRAHHHAIRQQASTLFSVQMRRVFAELGYRTTRSTGLLPASLRTVGFASSKEAEAGQCECEMGDNWCAVEQCREPSGGCSGTTTGCGFLGCGPCNGTCGGRPV